MVCFNHFNMTTNLSLIMFYSSSQSVNRSSFQPIQSNEAKLSLKYFLNYCSSPLNCGIKLWHQIVASNGGIKLWHQMVASNVRDHQVQLCSHILDESKTPSMWVNSFAVNDQSVEILFNKVCLFEDFLLTIFFELLTYTPS